MRLELGDIEPLDESEGGPDLLNFENALPIFGGWAGYV